MLEAQYREKLQAKDREINIYKQQSVDMLEIVKLQASRPITVEAKAVAESKSQGDTYKQSGNFGIGHMSGGTIEKDAKVAGVINESQSKNLTEVATKIQKQLDYFEQNDPPISQGKKIVKLLLKSNLKF